MIPRTYIAKSNDLRYVQMSYILFSRYLIYNSSLYLINSGLGSSAKESPGLCVYATGLLSRRYMSNLNSNMIVINNFSN